MLCVITVKIVNKLINTGTMLKSILIDTMQNTIEYINITHVTNIQKPKLNLVCKLNLELDKIRAEKDCPEISIIPIR